MPANTTYVASFKLANGLTVERVLDESVDHLYTQDGEELALAHIDTAARVVSFDLTCAMQPHEAEDWCSELATSLGGLEFVAIANPNA